jgi:ADP-ribose diphosphatase
MSEYVFRGKILNLKLDPLTLVDGRTIRLEVVEHGDSVGVLPVTEDGKALLVRQYRHATRETLLEIVAGNVEAGEKPEESAQRELAEEVGYQAEEMVPLGGIYLCPGYVTEFMHLFLARGLRPATAAQDEDEVIEPVDIPLDELYRQARQGELRDSKTLAALLAAEGHLGSSSVRVARLSSE